MNQPHPFSILLAEESRGIASALRQMLSQAGYAVTIVDTAEAASRIAQQSPPHLLITSTSLPGIDGYQLCRQLRQIPITRKLPVLMLAAQNDTSAKVAAFQVGADDYLAKPFQPEEFLYRVKGLLARATTPAEQLVGWGNHGRLIAVFGSKGGVGKTTVAVNLAIGLRRRTSKRVLLIDADFFFGNVDVHLNLTPNRTILDLLPYIKELDQELLDQIIMPHSSGIRALLNPPAPEEAEFISVEHLNHLIPFVTQYFDYVVVDCQPNYDDRMLNVLEQANDILLLVTPEIGPLKNTSHFLALAPKIGLDEEKIRLVLNRADSDVGIQSSEIARTLKHQIACSLNSGGRAVPLSANRGVPLLLSQPDHPFARQIMQLVDQLIAQQKAHGTMPLREIEPARAR